MDADTQQLIDTHVKLVIQEQSNLIQKGVRPQDFDICPHCKSEIYEKHVYSEDGGKTMRHSDCGNLIEFQESDRDLGSDWSKFISNKKETSENILTEDISKFNHFIKNIKLNGSDINKKMRLIEGGYVPTMTVDVDDNYLLEGIIDLAAAHRLGISNISVKYITSPILSEQIQELFRSDIPEKINKTDDGNYYASFNIDDENYNIRIIRLSTVENSYEFRFLKTINIGKINSIDDLKNQAAMAYGKPNLKHEYELYSRVISTLLKFIRDNSPNMVVIVVENLKKGRIYDKIIKKFIPTNYEYINKSSGEFMGILVSRNFSKDKIKESGVIDGNLPVSGEEKYSKQEPGGEMAAINLEEEKQHETTEEISIPSINNQKMFDGQLRVINLTNLPLKFNVLRINVDTADAFIITVQNT